MSERIANRCPYCGAQSLYVDEAGWIRCTTARCPTLERWITHAATQLAAQWSLKQLPKEPEA